MAGELDVERLGRVIRLLVAVKGWPKGAVGFDEFVRAIAAAYAEADR